MIPVTLIFAAITGSVLVNGCGGNETAEAHTTPDANENALAVRIETVSPKPLVENLTVAGILKATDDVLISPEEGGVVKQWKVGKGDRVKAGDVLVHLKDEVLRSSFDAANAQYQLAQLNVEKQKAVYEEQGLSELQYRTMVYNRDAAKANADLMKARLDRARIASPVDGVLDEQFFDVGEFAPPAMPIAHVVNLHRMKILADIPERHVGSVTLGTPVNIAFDAFPGDTIRSTVSFVGSTVSQNNRAMAVEILIPNPGLRLKPEMIAKVRLERAAKQAAIVLPESALQLVDRDRYVVYVEKDGVATERTVHIGSRQNSSVEIIDGLRPGEHVIMTDVEKLANGTRVVVAQ
jgi:RND family efflux transporter MFP subunit